MRVKALIMAILLYGMGRESLLRREEMPHENVAAITGRTVTSPSATVSTKRLVRIKEEVRAREVRATLCNITCKLGVANR